MTSQVAGQYNAALTNLRQGILPTSSASGKGTTAYSESTLTTALDAEECEKTGEGLRGRGVVVTGAGSGFGKQYAIKAASFGAKLVLSDINVAAVTDTCNWINSSGGTAIVYPHPCDTSSWDSQIKMFAFASQELKKDGGAGIDVVVPNAGVGETGEWLQDEIGENGELKKPSFQTINVNLIGVAYSVKIGFHYLRQNPTKRKKSIVLIGSMASFSGIPKAPAYSLAKHGVVGLFRSIYFNGVAEGINVNMIAPWFCDTAIIAPLTRIGIFGLPLTQISDVVAGMIKASSDESFSGNVLCIDADGVLVIPFEAYGAGEGGYYTEFARRAQQSISVEKKLRDVGLIVNQTFHYWTRTRKGQLAVFGTLFVLLRWKWGRSRHP